MHSKPVLQLDMILTKSTNEVMPTAVATEVTEKDVDSIEKTSTSMSTELPPMDEGRAAYSVLLAVTILTVMPFGVIFSFGVFFQYYVLERYEHADQAVWIGGISTGIMSLCAPLMVYACLKLTPRLPLVYYILVGWLLSFVGLLSAAFCHSIPMLILTQGVLLGIGALFLGYPSLMVLNSWFVNRRGFAYGICFASTKIAGVGLAFLVNYLLHSRGRRTTFIILTALVGAVPLAALPFLHERGTTTLLQRASSDTKPAAKTTSSSSLTASLTRAYYAQPLFFMMVLASFFKNIGYAIPTFYLSTYSADVLGLPTYTGPLLLALQNATAIIAKPLFGYLSDIGSLQALMITTSSTCAVSAIVLWGIASMLNTTSARIAMLAFFALVFSLAGQGFSSLCARMSLCFRRILPETGTAIITPGDAAEEAKVPAQHHQSKEQDESQQVYAWLNVGRGLAYIVSGPVSEAILDPANDKTFGTYGLMLSRVFGGGPGWRALIIFTACMMMASALMGFAAWAVDKNGVGASIRSKKARGHVVDDSA